MLKWILSQIMLFQPGLISLSFVLFSFIITNTRGKETRNQTKLKAFDMRLIIRHSSRNSGNCALTEKKIKENKMF